MAGLAAATELSRAGREVLVLEASDGPGGRVRTDEVDGHLLDRGFQILLAGYPEAARLLDYGDLDLQAFTPGALVWWDGRFHRLGDPLREPARLFDTLRAPIGSPIDKARILAFRRAVSKGTLDELWERPETTARQRLEAAGFGPDLIDRFLAPLFAGITLDPDLSGSSRVVEFVFRMLAAGDAVVPAAGMGAISDQLADRLPEGTVRLSAPVAAVQADEVQLADGERIEAQHVIVATGMTAASELVGVDDRGWKGVTSIWFSADESPMAEPVLMLDGAATGALNSVAVMSEVSSAYAPAGRSTVVASFPSVGPGVADAIRTRIGDLFEGTDRWDVLRVDEIARSQPRHPVGHQRSGFRRLDTGVWLCGDHLADASINGALASGAAAGRAVSARSGA